MVIYRFAGRQLRVQILKSVSGSDVLHVNYCEITYSFYMDLEIQNAVADVFSEYNDVVAVFLLGSTASGNSRPDSDIDLAVLTDGGKILDPFIRVNIANLLSYLFSKPVDLGQISSENLVFAREALLKGNPVFVRDAEKMNLIRANLLGMYIQYNIDRKEVVDAYSTG